MQKILTMIFGLHPEGSPRFINPEGMGYGWTAMFMQAM